MTTSTSNRQTISSQAMLTIGFPKFEGPREAQFIDYAASEETYELLPSGD
jgi:hypothetical protein